MARWIIVDTDLDTDCDDVGALALAHRHAAAAGFRLAGIVVNAPVPAAGRYAQLLAAHWGLPTLPVGLVDAAAIADGMAPYAAHRADCAPRLYNERLCGKYAALLAHRPPPEEGVALYRRLLSEAEDGSVVICAIGFLTVLAQLLDSPGGADLVRRKVRLLVSMGGGNWPEGWDGFNWRMAPKAAARVLNDWPVDLAISPEGENVLTIRSWQEGPPDPAREAYRIFFPDRSLRPSWDLLCVLYGLGDRSLFRGRTGCRFRYNPETGQSIWTPDPASRARLVELAVPPDQAAARLEEILS